MNLISGEMSFGVGIYNSYIVFYTIIETRTSGSPHIWQLLRNACEEDAATAEALILAAGLQMPQNSLTTAIDENGVYYRVPIACINEPVNYN